MCALGGGSGGGGAGTPGGRGRGGDGGGGDGADDEYSRLWPFFIPLLHAANKGLLAWAVAPELRDLVVRVVDVGFLGFFGGLAALATAAPAHALVGLRLALVKVGLAHMLLETLVNGILLPLHRCPDKVRCGALRCGALHCGCGCALWLRLRCGYGCRCRCRCGVVCGVWCVAVRPACGPDEARAAVWAAACGASVLAPRPARARPARALRRTPCAARLCSARAAQGARSPTLRPGIWAHHVLAAIAFSAVLVSGAYAQDAVFLCTTEVTAALPPALQEMRRARRERAEPELAASLVLLMLTGFAFRCAVSWAVVVPNARPSVRAMLELARGEAAAPGVAAARGVVWSCAVGLGALNCHWMHRVLLGARKAVAKARGGAGASGGKSARAPAAAGA